MNALTALCYTLPPLSKGGGLTARHKLFFCFVLFAIYPPFLFIKLFCRQDGGIVIPLSLRPVPTLPKPHYPLLRTITLASPRKRGGGTANATLVFINTKFRKSVLNISQTNSSRDGGDCSPSAPSMRFSALSEVLY